MNLRHYPLVTGCQKPSLVSALQAHFMRPNLLLANLLTPARGTNFFILILCD